MGGSTKSNASLYLKNLDIQAQINSDGSMDVVETWDINISDTNTLYKTFNKDKQQYSALTNIFVEEVTNGTNKQFQQSKEWKYHLPKDYYFGGTNDDGKYEISWGVSVGSSSTRRQFKIKYTVQDVVHKYSDCAELYWKFVGEDFEISANNIQGYIKLPQNVANKEEIKVWGHTKLLNGEINVISTDEIEFNINNYKAGNYVETRIAMPTYLLNNAEITSNTEKLETIIAEETKWADEANKKRIARDREMKIIMVAIAITTTAIGLVFLKKIKKNKQVLNDNPKIKPEIELDYYRELPDATATPLEAIFMIKKGYNQMYLSDAFSAIILDLALKKYIQIKQEDKQITIEILTQKEENLQEDEQKVFELLKQASKDNILTMKTLEKYIKAHTSKLTNLETKFEKYSKEKAIEKEKYSREKETKASIYIAKLVGYVFLTIAILMANFIGIGMTANYIGKIVHFAVITGLFTLTVLIINATLTIRIIKRFDGFTQKGINEIEQWKALKKYMEEFSYLNEKEVPHLVIWEKFLVFATAFGIADKVLKQLKVKYPELNNQETINNMVLFNAMYNSNGFNTKFINSISSSTSRMYSSTFSSGSGSGGGFSGGGGFGRRRRWPEVADKRELK